MCATGLRQQCLRHSGVFRHDLDWNADGELALLTIYQAQSGMPFTISVFRRHREFRHGAGRESHSRERTGQPILGPGRATPTNGLIRRPSRLRQPIRSAMLAGTRFTAPSADSGLCHRADFSSSEKTSFQFRARRSIAE